MQARMVKCSVALLALTVGAFATFFVNDATPAPPTADQLRPQWRAGDRWVVKTTTKGLERGAAPVEQEPVSVHWEFTVKKAEKIAGHDCHRLEIRCLDEHKKVDEQQPMTILWVDCKAMVLRQCRMQVPTPAGFRAITESYAFGDGQLSPVLAPFTALPVDLPLFRNAMARGSDKFTYEASSGHGLSRGPDEIAFGLEVEQHMEMARPEEIKRLAHHDFSRGLDSKPVVEVKLRGADREVRQLWQVGQPWPVYASNGGMTARLIEVTSAGSK